MAGDYSALQVLVTANTRQFGQQVAQAAGAAGDDASRSIASRMGAGLGAAAKGIGTVVATGFTVAAGAASAFGGAVLLSGKSYNTLVQTSTAAFKTILGSGEAATAMMDQLSAFAKTSPFPRQAFIEATQQMLAFGFASEDVIPTLDAIQNAVAATGGSASSIGEIADVLSKVQSTGKITADTLNQLGFRGIDAAKLIGQGMGQTAEQIRDSISKGTLDAGQAMTVLTEQMNVTFGGAAANVKNTWAGATDRVKGAMRDIGSAIVEPFISKAGGGLALEWANKFADLLRKLEPLVKPFIDAMMVKLGPALAQISPFIDRIASGIAAFAARGGAGIGSILDNLKQFAPVLAPIVGLLLKAGGANIAGAFGPLGGIISSVTGAFGPLGSTLIALIATMPSVREGIGQIMGTLGQLITPIMGVVNAISGALQPVIGTIVSTLSGVLSALMPVLGTLATVIGSTFTALAPIISSVVSTIGSLLVSLMPVINTVVTTIGGLLAQLLPLLGPIINIIGQLVGQVAGALGPVLQQLVPVIGQLVGALAGPLLSIITTIGNAFVSIMPAISTLVGLLGDLLTGALKALMPAITKVAQVIADVLAKALPAVMPLVSKLAELVGTILAKAMAVVLPVIEKLATIIADVLARALPVLIPIIDQLATAFMSILDALMPVVDILLQLVSQVLAALLPALTPLIDAVLQLVVAFLPLLPVVAQLIATLLPPLVQLLMLLLPPVVQLVTWLAQLIAIFAQFAAILIGSVAKAITWLVENFTRIPGIIWNAISGLPGMLAGLFTTAVNAARDAIVSAAGAIYNWFRDLPGSILRTIGNVLGTLAGVGRDIITGLFNAITSSFSQVWSWFNNLASVIFGAIPNPLRMLWDAGVNIIQGLIDGIGSMIGKVGDAIGNVVGAVTDHLPWSPAKVGPLHDHPPYKSGVKIAEQLASGLTAGMPAVDEAMMGLTALATPAFAGDLGVGAAAAGRGIVVNVDQINDPVDLDAFAGRLVSVGARLG